MSKCLVKNINPTMLIAVLEKNKTQFYYKEILWHVYMMFCIYHISGKLQKVDLEGFMENLDSTDDESDSEENRTSPNESGFSQGQVYYSSLGKQVHVYPENVGGDVEVTVI